MIYGKDLMSISAMILMKGLIASEKRKNEVQEVSHILPVIGLHQNPTWELYLYT